MLPRPLVIAIVCAVAVLWVVNVALGMIDPTRGVPGLNWIFGLVVGGALAADRPTAKGVAQRIARMIDPPDDKGEELP